MPFYVGDYIKDTRRLTTLEHGAYLLLIMEYWLHGSLPVDDQELANVTLLPIDSWREIKAKIERFFGPNWTHKRIDAELAKADKKSMARADAGAKGGHAKAERRAEKLANAKVLSQQKSTDALASSSESQSQKEKISRKALDIAFAEFWQVFPKRVKEEAARRKFETKVRSGTDPVDIVAGAKRYARSVLGTEPKFIQAPDVWLNNGRWKDELPGDAKPGDKSLAEIGQVFVEKDSDAGRAWWDYRFRTKGSYPATTERRTDAGIKTGWYFPSEWPPGLADAERAA